MAYVKKFKPTDAICRVKNCGGALFNITSRLAQATGIITVRCDKCGKIFGAKVEK